jgi:hypothetical protein
MLHDVLDVSLRALDILLLIESDTGRLGVSILLLQNIGDRVQGIHIRKTFASHRVKEFLNFGWVVGIQLQFHRGVIVDVNKNVADPRRIHNVRVVKAVPQIFPVGMLSHRP